MSGHVIVYEGDISRTFAFPDLTKLSPSIILRELAEHFKFDDSKELPLFMESESRALKLEEFIKHVAAGASGEFELIRRKLPTNGGFNGSRKEDTEAEKGSRATESSGVALVKAVSIVSDLKQVMVNITRSQNKVTLIIVLKNSDFTNFNNMNLQENDFLGIGNFIC
jgi:hypothetical protein